MAYLPEDPLEKEKRLQQQGPQLASGSSGVITGSQASAQQQGAVGPSRSGAWTNLNSYLDANKDQAAQLGNRVAGNLANQAEQAKTQVGEAVNQFRQDVDRASVSRNQWLVNQAVSDPTRFVQDQDRFGQFQKMRDARYTGPAGLEENQVYGTGAQKLRETAKKIQGTATEAGRFAQVQEQFAKPTYSRGQQRLDQLLLQNNTDTRNAFGQLRHSYQPLEGYLDQTRTQSADYAQQRRAETDAAAQDVRQALGGLDDPSTAQNEAAGAFGQFQTDLRGRTEAMRKAEEQKYKGLLDTISAAGSKNALNADQSILDMLGLKEGENLYDVDLSQFQPQFNAHAINEQSVASADDYARYAALAQLSGQDPQYLYDNKLAGSAKGTQFDQAHLRSVLDNRKAVYGQTVGELGGLYGALQDLGRSSFVNTSGVTDAGQMNLDAVRNALNSANSYGGADWQQWLGDARAGGGGAVGSSYRALSDWLNRYERMNPNRTVSRQ